jgi:hypothetical protein
MVIVVKSKEVKADGLIQTSLAELSEESCASTRVVLR